MTYVLLLYVSFFMLITNCHSEANETVLEQVHIIFRHGDRAPDKISMYPNDPHINDTWYPEGLGALTILGKQQEYNLGKSIRKRYGEFLGDVYLPGIQEATSTSVTRAKISLQLVLASLWPPIKQQQFDSNLSWQPIEYNYKSFEEDDLLGFPLIRKECVNYFNEFIKQESSLEVQKYFQENKDKINYINMKSGLQIKAVFQLTILYFGLYAEEHTNRALPLWTKSIYPEFLENAAIRSYLIQTATNNMLKSTGGPIIKKVLQEGKDKISGKTPPSKKKIFLYSGHEYNIAHTLAALKCFKEHIPQYSSHVIFELHKNGSKYGFKVFYQDTKHDEPQNLNIPGCGYFCPIEDFERIMKDVIPDSSHKC